MANFLRDFTSAAVDLVSTATDIIVNKSDLEKKLDGALSSANSGTSNSVLREIAAATKNHQDLTIVMSAIWTAIGQPPRLWQHVYKGLVLLEMCIKEGSERCVDDARDYAFRVRSLKNFSSVSDGKDQGAGIREIATRLEALLADDTRLRAERRKAKEMHNSFVGISNEGALNNGGGRGGSVGGSYPSNVRSTHAGRDDEWDNSRAHGFDQSSSHTTTMRTGGIGRGSRGGGNTLDTSFGSDGDGAPEFGTGRQQHQQPASKVGAGAGRRGRRHAASLSVDEEEGQDAAQNSRSIAKDAPGFGEFGEFGAAAATVAKPAPAAAHGGRRHTASPIAASADFDDFTFAPAPVASTRPVPGLPRVTIAVKAPAAAVDSFDPFGVPAPARAAPAGGDFDFFGTASTAPAPAHSHVPAPVLARVPSDSFDPFASPEPVAPVVSMQVSSNPFGSPLPSGPAGVGVNNPFASGQGLASPDGFGSFAAASSFSAISPSQGMRADSDVDRLVALDRLNLSKGGPAGSQAKPGPGVAPLKVLAAQGGGSGMGMGMGARPMGMAMGNAAGMGMGMGMQFAGAGMGVSAGMGVQPQQYPGMGPGGMGPNTSNNPFASMAPRPGALGMGSMGAGKGVQGQGQGAQDAFSGLGGLF